MKNNLIKLLLLVIFSLIGNTVSAQLAKATYSVKLAYVKSVCEDGCSEIFSVADYTAYIKSWDNINTSENNSNCLTCEAESSATCIYGQNLLLQQNRTNTSDILYGYINAWEDDCGARCDFNDGGCWGDNDQGNLEELFSFNFRQNAYPSINTTYNLGPEWGYTNLHRFRLSYTWKYTGTDNILTPTCSVQTSNYAAGAVRSWSVNLTAGVTYNFNNCSGAANNTFMKIYGADGYTGVEGNDNSCGQLSQIEFTPTTSGTYYIELFEINGGVRRALTVGGALSYSIVGPSMPTVTSPVNYYPSYTPGTATTLTAGIGTNGTGLLWYTTATGGTGSSQAPTPSLLTPGSTSYWVSTVNSSGCESARSEIVVIVANRAPTDITLTNSSINELLPANTLVGQFFTVEPDENNIYNYTYSFVSGAGSEDNSAFTIQYNRLRIIASPDYETKNSYNIRIRTTDPGGLWFEKQFTITINDIDETAATNLNFDGINDRVNLNYFPVPQNMTVEAWVKTTSNDNVKRSILGWSGNYSNGTTTVGGAYIHGVAVYQGKLHYYEYDGPTPTLIEGSSTTSINDDNWHHVAVTRTNATTNNTKIYVDGVLEATFTATLVLPTTELHIGKDYSYLFNGSIDELRIWNVERTADQINRSKNCELQGTEAGLISYYKFNQGLNAGNNTAITQLTATTGANGNLLGFAKTGTTSNFLADSPVSTGSIIPSVPIVSTPVTYNQGITASALTATVGANGTGLIWYSSNTSTTPLTNAQLTPSTTTAGSTSYWVSSVNTNGCESTRVELVVTVLANTAPTDITLSANSLNENIPTYSLVGTLSTTDSNSGNTFTYNLVGGAGGEHSYLFYISNNELKLTVSPDFEVHNSYNVKVRSTDQGGLTFTKSFVVTINNLPETIALSATTVDENVGANATVAALSVVDLNVGNVFTYTLVSGNGDTDNASFSISGTNLIIIPNPNFETKSSYNIRVRATEQGGLFFEKEFTITINDLVETGVASHLNFDGTNDYVNIPHFERPQTMTVEAWIKSGATTQQTIAAWGGTNTAEFKTQSNTVAYFESAGTSSVVSAPLTSDNNWHHVAITRTNAATNNVKLYVDGVNVATGTVNLNIATNTFDIGAVNTSTRQNFFNGSIDEVRIWNIERTSNEIFNSKNCELQGNEAGLISYCKFNQELPAGNNLGVTTLRSTVGSNGTISGFGLTGTTSNFLSGSIVTSGSIIPSVPSVVTPITYVMGAIASPLTATVGAFGSSLVWYDSETSTTVLTGAQLTPSTATIGSTTYWVASANANGCQSARVPVVVTITSQNASTDLHFDGSNDNLSLPSTISTDGSYTKEAMIYLTSTSSTRQIISSTYAKLYIDSGLLEAYNNTTGNRVRYTTAAIAANTWYHIAVTYDAPSTTLKLYVNGLMVSQNTTVPAAYSANTFVGYDGSFGYFNGSMDEVRIWNVARTADQIFGSKNCELQGNESGLVAYYKFNEGIAAGNNTAITTVTATTGPNVSITSFARSGTTSNFINTSPITSGSIIPSVPTVNPQVVTYPINATANPLTATVGVNGTSLAWYSSNTSTTALTGAQLTPSTATEGETVYWVASTNANGCESTRVPVLIRVTAPNTAPTNIALSANIVQHNGAVNAVVGTLSSVDSNFQNVFIYNLASGSGDDDNESFVINNNILKITVSPNIEVKSSYSIRVRSTDQGGLFFEKEFIITVNGPASNLNFDGVNDNLTIPYNAAFAFFTGNFTVEAMVKTTDASSGAKVAIGHYRTISGNTYSYWLGMENGNPVFAIQGTANIQGTTAISDGQWHHLLGVRDNGIAYLYVDGVLIGQVNNTTSLVFTSTSNTITIGNFNGGNNFSGAMDEVRVWNIARTEAQINASIDCELDGTESGLLAYYKFNQGLAANNNTGIATAIGTIGGDAPLNNFARTGATSNFLAGSPIVTGVTCTTLDNPSFEAISNLKVYPNPSTGIFNISAQENVTIEVYDLVGKQIKTQEVPVGTSTLDISNYASGVYLLKAINAKGAVNNYKLIKQ